MSRHLLVSFAILAVFCAMTLSGKIEEHNNKKSSRVEVIDINHEHHKLDRTIKHGHSHDLHKLDGHDVHDHHDLIGHDHHDLVGHDHHDLVGHDHHDLVGHDHHDLLGHDHHGLPPVHVDKIIALPSHHDHGHDHGQHHGHDLGRHHCPKNEMWSKCGGGCQPSCQVPKPVCPAVCIAGCVCNRGLVRNAHGRCIDICKC